jgi:hypothetical protein
MVPLNIYYLKEIFKINKANKRISFVLKTLNQNPRLYRGEFLFLS